MTSFIVKRAFQTKVLRFAVKQNSTRNCCTVSNQKNILKSKSPDLVIPEKSIPELVFDAIGKYKNLIAVECGVTGRKYTYEEVRLKSRNFNRALRKILKLQRYDVVAILLPNMPEMHIAILGILLAGLRVTTLNPLYTADEIKRQLDDSGAKVLITLSQMYPNVKPALENNQIKVITISDKDSPCPQGTVNFQELIDSNVDAPDVYIDDVNEIAFMPYSSGTTGLPKGVLLSHKNIVSNVTQFRSPDFNPAIHATESYQEIIPAVLPMFHIYGFTSLALSNMLLGAKTITLPKFTPELYMKTLVEHKPTILFAVPPIVIFLYMHPMVTKESLSNVKSLVSGAAPLGALDEQKFLEKAGKSVEILQGYGLSESSPVVTFVSTKLGTKPGSTGKVIPNTTVRIMPMDNQGEPLGPNRTGELQVKGPQVMVGYHNRPKETSETLVDGWLRTGDMFYYDEDENFFITDRIKELIKVKGFQVPPAELEEVIRDFPEVGDAAVIGVPHEIYGEVPRAYIVPKSNSKIDVQKLDNFIREKVAEYKRIRGGFVVTDAIPKNAAGKILRRELKDKYAKELK